MQKCRGGKYKACKFQNNHRSNSKITIKGIQRENLQKCTKTAECSICFVQKPINDIAYIDCVKKGIYTINVGRRTTLRHPICIDCEIRCNNSCPFCRSHGFIDLLKYPDNMRFRKKKPPWRIRNIMISIKKKEKKRKSFRKDRELFKEQIKRRVYTIEYYRYCKHARVILLNNINILTKEINDLKNKINNFIK